MYCDKTLKIVQGDTLSVSYSFKKNGQILEPDSVYFTSDKLKLQKSLVQSNNHNWLLTLSFEDTKDINPCKATYDITIYIDDNVYTVVYCADLFILEKINEVENND